MFLFSRKFRRLIYSSFFVCLQSPSFKGFKNMICITKFKCKTKQKPTKSTSENLLMRTSCPFPPGDLNEARRVLEALEKARPGLAVVRIRRAALERRAGRLDQSEALLREAVAESKERPTLHAFYSIKLARLLLKVARHPDGARTVLQEALEISPVRLEMEVVDLSVEQHDGSGCLAVSGRNLLQKN